MESWCERWNVKISEDKTQSIYFSHRRKPVDAHLTLKGRHSPSVNNVKYLGVIFHKKLRIETASSLSFEHLLAFTPF